MFVIGHGTWTAQCLGSATVRAGSSVFQVTYKLLEHRTGSSGSQVNCQDCFIRSGSSAYQVVIKLQELAAFVGKQKKTVRAGRKASEVIYSQRQDWLHCICKAIMAQDRIHKMWQFHLSGSKTTVGLVGVHLRKTIEAGILGIEATGRIDSNSFQVLIYFLRLVVVHLI